MTAQLGGLALGLGGLEPVGLVVGVVLTLMMFSYLLGDNPAYRLALHLFLGAVAGYAFGVVSWEILILRVGVPLVVGRRYVVLVPLVLGALVLLKFIPKRAYLGNVSIGLLVGTGAAVAVSGAILGTIVPQIGATARAAAPSSWPGMPLRALDGLLIIVGTVCTLLAFRVIGRGARKRPAGCALPAKGVAQVGRWFLVVTFGIAFGGALTAALSILVGRVQYLIGFVVGLL